MRVILRTNLQNGSNIKYIDFKTIPGLLKLQTEWQYRCIRWWGKIDGNPLYTPNRRSDLFIWGNVLKLVWIELGPPKGFLNFPFLSSKNWHFCDFNKRAIIHPLTVNYSGLDKNFKNPFDGPSSIDASFQTIPHMTKLGMRFGLWGGGGIDFGHSSYIFIPFVQDVAPQKDEPPYSWHTKRLKTCLSRNNECTPNF